MKVKISYDENFKVTGIGQNGMYETDEEYILLDITDQDFEHLLETPFNTLYIDKETKNVCSTSTIDQCDEVETVTLEGLKEENEDLKQRLSSIEKMLSEVLNNKQ